MKFNWPVLRLIISYIYFFFFFLSHTMFLSRNKKNNVHPCKPQFYYIKVEFKGSKLYRRVFVMVRMGGLVMVFAGRAGGFFRIAEPRLLLHWPFNAIVRLSQEAWAGVGGSVGCAVRLETRRSRVQPPPRSATFFRGD